MGLRTELESDVLLFYVSGEIDHHSAALLRAAMDEQLATLKPGEVIIDLSETDFMDSSGLGLILGRVRVAELIGAKLSVRCPNERIRRILDMAGAQRFLHYA